jgi:hypothetical protein
VGVVVAVGGCAAVVWLTPFRDMVPCGANCGWSRV